MESDDRFHSCWYEAGINQRQPGFKKKRRVLDQRRIAMQATSFLNRTYFDRKIVKDSQWQMGRSPATFNKTFATNKFAVESNVGQKVNYSSEISSEITFVNLERFRRNSVCAGWPKNFTLFMMWVDKAKISSLCYFNVNEQVVSRWGDVWTGLQVLQVG